MAFSGMDLKMLNKYQRMSGLRVSLCEHIYIKGKQMHVYGFVALVYVHVDFLGGREGGYCAGLGISSV